MHERLQSEMTQRQRAEAVLAHQAGDLARFNTTLAQFTAVASHNFLELLRTVTNSLQLLTQLYHGRLDATADECMTTAVDGVIRIQRLVQELLDYVRVETPQQVRMPTNGEEG